MSTQSSCHLKKPSRTPDPGTYRPGKMSSLKIIKPFAFSLALALLPALATEARAELASPPGQTTVDEELRADRGAREELLETELADTQRKYELEVLIKPRLEDLLDEEYVRFPVRFKYGITANWESFLELNTFVDNFTRSGNRNGMSDVALGTKYRFKRRLKPYVDTAVSFSIRVPTGSNDDISGGYTHYAPQLIFTKTLVHFHGMRTSASLGFDIVAGPPAEEARPDNSMSLAIGATYPRGRASYSMEAVYVTTETGGGTINALFLTPGFQWDIPRDRNPLPGEWRLGLGARFGLFDAEEDFVLLTRLKWDFNLKYKVDLEKVIEKGGELLDWKE